MKQAAFLFLLATSTTAFVANVPVRKCLTSVKAYVPDGMTPEQYKALKEKESKKKVGKFDGLSGAKFRSRSMADYQKGREAGTLRPNMPMEMSLKKLNTGKIRPIDIPYMQRPNGKPDNSDLTPQGFWKRAPKGMSGPGVTGPVPGVKYKGTGAGMSSKGSGGGFKLPWQK